MTIFNSLIADWIRLTRIERVGQVVGKFAKEDNIDRTNENIENELKHVYYQSGDDERVGEHELDEKPALDVFESNHSII